MNVFLDTNVIIDFMGEREGFFDDAAAIFAMIEDGIITASASALTIVNCAYILKKAFSSDIMLEKVEDLCQMLNVTPIDRSQLMNAVQLKPYDYEDAVQYLSALPSHPDVIITRDKKGFNDLGILVMTPAEFVQKAKE
ncbi:MAG: PIN domain-containing protein [Prevotella sp.]|nr:PIN domain-containing protein [Prevotella sp.]MBR6827181.1 PIN domain-containing protein [Prevotella sp.]